MAEALTGVGATSAAGTVTPVIRIALTGVSARVRQGFLTKHNLPGESFSLAAPRAALTLTAVTGQLGSLAIDVAAQTLAMTGTVPIPGTVEISFQPTLAMTGVAGAAGRLALAAPRVGVSLSNHGGLRISVPRSTLALQGKAGVVATLALRRAATSLALTGLTETIGTLTINQRAPRLSMSMASGRTGAFDCTLPAPTLTMTGVIGAHGTLSIELLPPELRFTGHFAALGALVIEIPVVRLAMYGVAQGTAAQITAARVTYALQTERQALTKYTNFPFNSFAAFAGRYLAAGPDGIFELVGDTDSGTAIQAAARFGVTDLGTSRVKRVENVYIGVRAAKGDKALLLRVLTNETQQRDYGVKASISDGLHTTRVDLGKGVEARYWQFELRNRDGADFSVDTVEVQPTPTRRRLGAKDA